MSRLAGFLTALAVMAVGTPLWAQSLDVSQARLSALSFGALDRGQAVEVRLQDDSEDNKAVKAALEQALTQAGYRLAPNARYVLSFEATNSLTANDPKRPTVFSVDGHKGSYDDSVEARIKLFSTGEDSVLKHRPDEGPQGTAGSVRLELGVIDRSGGKRLWQGWAQTPVQTSDTLALTKSLAQPLVAHLGLAVKNKSVPLGAKQ
ncbi:exported hypothetical protein [Rhodospirillaceae bacterium LM-1]|nr:exported hypothetical protein [Rhodospirillaceae bacterium LM-1]